MSDQLSVKQLAFCAEYIVDGNATQAAIRAGYARKHATSTASRLLAQDKVCQRVEHLRQQAEKDKIASHNETCQILTEIIRATLGDHLEGLGLRQDKLKSHALQEVVIESKVGVDGQPEERTKVKLRDPVAAIAQLAKLKGYYPEKTKKVEIGGPGGKAIRFIREPAPESEGADG